MPILKVESGPFSGRAYEFDRTVVVGRDDQADLPLGHQTVSRQHAMLRWASRQCYIVDLDSANGTFVNGRRIAKPTALADGDLVVLGTIRVRFGTGEAPREPSGDRTTIAWTDRGVSAAETRAFPAYGSSILAPAPPSEPASVEALARQLSFQEEFARMSCRRFDEPALLEFLVKGCFALLPAARRVSILLANDDATRMLPAATRSREGPVPEIRLSRTLIQHVVDQREAMLVDSEDSDAQSILCVPIVFDDRTLGVIHADAGSTAERFCETDLAMLVRAAGPVGLALAYTRLHAQEVEQEVLAHDMAIATKVQQQFLPQRMPSLDGYTFDVDFDPAAGVGGDFYDVLQLAPDVWCLGVGDVCGKGVSAALFAAKVGSDLRYQAIGETEPAAILQRVNRVICAGGQEDMFVTAVLATLHVSEGRLLVSSAGHPWPIVRRATGQTAGIAGTSDAPLGVSPDTVFHQREYVLSPGEIAVFFTDGLTEALDASGELFGEERLENAISASDGTPRHVVEVVRSCLDGFVGQAPQSDDRTLLCLRYDGGRKKPATPPAPAEPDSR